MKTFADRAYELQLSGMGYEEVVGALQAEGAGAASAHAYAQQLDWATDVHAPDYAGGPVRADRSGDMAVGVMWLVGGIAITVLTYAVAPPGGTYFIAWGPAVYGFAKLMRAAS